jgi:hypothetical protein
MLQDKHAALLLHCRVDRVLRHLVSALALSVPSIRRSLKLSLTFEAEPLSPGRRRKRPVHVDSCERKAPKREHIDGGAMDATEVVRAAAEAGGMNSGDSDSAVDARIWRLTLTVGTAGVRRCPTLNGIIGTLNGIIGTLNGIIGTLNGRVEARLDDLLAADAASGEPTPGTD